MAATTDSKRPTVRVGVFVPSEFQLLDMACVDIFAMLSHDYLSNLEMLPTALTSLAPNVDITYVGTGSTVPTTARADLVVTHHLSDPEVGPGRFDVVLVPGPDPKARFGDDVTSWLKRQGEQEGTDVLCVCTGVFLCGEAGLLKGRTVSGPRGLQGVLKERFEGLKLVGDRYRWARDGNLWSSGGVTNGNDLVAAYARESGRFPGPVVEAVCKLADVGDRPREYGTGQTLFNLGFAWVLLKAWLMGFGKTKTS